MDTSILFEKLKVKGKEFRNRIVMPPMVSCRAITSEDGIEWYRRHAEGGVALVIVEATDVGKFVGGYTKDDLAPLAAAIHGQGALAAIQLFPLVLRKPAEPQDLSLQDIKEMLEAYNTATSICRDAGFDGVEPHGAHNYVLNQFFSPVQNKREDEYGGEIEGRMKLGLEIVETVKSVSEDMIVLYRHTPCGRGYREDKSVVFAEKLIQAGVDILDISPGWAEVPGDRSGSFMGLGVPVITVKELDIPENALEVLKNKRADLIAIGRGLIADPDWPKKAEQGDFESIVNCIRCNELCYGNIKTQDPVACTQWT